MILDFDLTEASERPISVYKAYSSINSSLTIKTPCRAFWCLVGRSERFYPFINLENSAEHAYKYTLLMYNQCINV